MAYILRRALTYSLYFLPIIAQYTPSPRWGQAVALLDNTLYVHGGLSDPFNSYSYSSAPELSDLLRLDLSECFSSSSPPWQLLSNAASPALSWHTLSAFNSTELLLFGGQPDPNSQTVLPTLNDSAGLLATSNLSSPYLLMEPQNWASQPMRRIRHSSSFSAGRVWIIGGEKADGSGNAFDDHYYFDPSDAQFIRLPSSSNSPPDIYGHASFVLPDGRLLVLGGYCASCSELVPMSTIWSLNTTQSPPSWEQLFTATQSLPDSRRDFASVVLPNGQILIHGGGDAQLQTTYGDGWILDTSQNPMVWHSVEQLAQLGERKDHFAVQVGGYVFFSFGYGASSPASASLFIYDSTTSSMVSSYTAPTPGPAPAITSLPIPTQTGDASAPSSSSTAPPASSPGSPPYTTSSSSGHHTTAIALGTIFGVLGLVAGGLTAMYYTKRARGHRSPGVRRFLPLGDDPGSSSEDESAPNAAPATRQPDSRTNEGGWNFARAGAIPDILAYLGFGNKSSQPRRDMFADEDARSFGIGGQSIALRREGSENTSIWSLRSMGALVRGMITREPSGSGADEEGHEWEKIDYPYGGDQAGLIRQENIPGEGSSAPSHRRDDSYWSYADPFQDPHSEDEYDDLNLRSGVPEKDADYDRPVPRSRGIDKYDSTALRPPDAPFSFSVPSRMLTPVREVSHTSLSEPSNSLPSLHQSSHEESTHGLSGNNTLPSTLTILKIPSPSNPSSPTAAYFSDTTPIATSPRYSSILHSTSPPSQFISRSDSWWSRFAMTPLLDRRTSVTSHKPLDFRDPTPAPPLVPVEESKKPSPIKTGSDAAPIQHDRSISSTHSARTANTASAEHLGAKYDVVQRLASDGSSSRRAPSLASAEITEQGVLDSGPLEAEVSALNKSLPADPPRSTLLTTNPSIPLNATTSLPPSGVTTLPTSPTRGAVVLSRVKAYERKMSQEIETQRSPAPRNTRQREEIPSRNRPTIKYGVAPRASLFIANPDSEHRP